MHEFHYRCTTKEETAIRISPIAPSIDCHTILSVRWHSIDRDCFRWESYEILMWNVAFRRRGHWGHPKHVIFPHLSIHFIWYNYKLKLSISRDPRHISSRCATFFSPSPMVFFIFILTFDITAASQTKAPWTSTRYSIPPLFHSSSTKRVNRTARFSVDGPESYNLRLCTTFSRCSNIATSSLHTWHGPISDPPPPNTHIYCGGVTVSLTTRPYRKIPYYENEHKK